MTLSRSFRREEDVFVLTLSGLLVTKWVHTVECLQSTSGKTTPEETKVLDNVRYLLSQIDVDRSPSCSLAADLARVWAGLYDDTWVWGGEYYSDLSLGSCC